MFGSSKQKMLDSSLILEKVPEAVIKVWTDKTSLQADKFSRDAYFATILAGNDKFLINFFQEKLRLITAVALISVYGAMPDDEFLTQLIAGVKAELGKIDLGEIKGVESGLSAKAREYATMRTSNNPREAGKLIENTFAKEVFGMVPSEDSTNARYLLYKQLSSLERKAIFEINNALRNSRV